MWDCIAFASSSPFLSAMATSQFVRSLCFLLVCLLCSSFSYGVSTFGVVGLPFCFFPCSVPLACVFVLRCYFVSGTIDLRSFVSLFRMPYVWRCGTSSLFCYFYFTLCVFLLSSVTTNRPTRYRVVPSPLPALRWWRLVIDEAHMVESTTQETAKMALQIPAQHR